VNKRSIDLLEKVFIAEINGALNKHPGLFQTKSKLAKQLADEGLILEETVKLGGRLPVTITGYRLTEFGRITYCMTCKDEELV